MLKVRYFAMRAVFVAAAAAAMAAGQLRAADDKTPGGEKERKLIGTLQSPADPQDKAMACKLLAIYGTKDAVPALATFLADEKLAAWARIGLEAIPDPAVDDALREAMGKLQGRLLVGVINSIGVRRDAKAVDGLLPKLTGSNAEVASAAAEALGHIGGDPVAKALEQALTTAPAAARAAVAEGCILCAERLLADGRRDAAVKLYDTVRKADVPQPKALEATRGAILARQSDGLPLLVDQLRSVDKARLNIGLRVARELPGVAVTGALVAELSRATPERQALLILALADRRDEKVLPAVLAAAKTGPVKARIAAVRVLERLGNVSCLPVLLDAALQDDEGLAQMAKSVLANLPGEQIDADLAARLPQAEGTTRRVLIELAGQRCLRVTLPALLKAANDPDAQIRGAALTALGAVIEMAELPVLIERVLHPQWPEDAKTADAALRAACVRMPDREACAGELVQRMPQAPVPAACTLLSVLGEMGGTMALQALGAAAKDTKPEIQDAATRALGEWMSTDAAPVLLDLARTLADEKYKIRALRGYIRIARQLELPAAERVAMCGEAMKLCQRDNEKNLVIEVLRRNPSAAGLALVTLHLGNAELKTEASEAAIAIAEKIIQSDPAAVADAMKQITEAGGDSKAIDRAKALMDRAARKSDASAPKPALPIKVSPNGRYFVDQSGKAFFWFGATQWQLFREYTLDDAKLILGESRKNGFTVLQVMLMGVGDGTAPNVAGQKPWTNDDPLMPNEAYFQNVDRVVQAAHDNDLLISMTVYHQRYRNSITVEKARAWAKWVAQRYKDSPNIVWSMTPQAKAEFVPAIREIAAGLREGDGGRHLITFKPDPSPYSSSFLHAENWLDFNSMQTWNAVRLIYPMLTNDYQLKPVKPVLMAEGAYEGSAKYGFEATPLWIRRQAYYSYLAGAHHTYGFNAASTNWQTMPTWKQDLKAPGAVQMGVLKKIFLARPQWWLLVPDQSILASGGRISRAPLPVQYATDEERSAYVRTLKPSGEGDRNDGSLLHLAARHQDGRWALIYLGDKATFSVDLSKLSGAKVNVSWLNPITGEATRVGQESNTGVKSFSTPDGWEDALLLLEAAGAAAPAAN